jgi:hypothetical protein
MTPRIAICLTSYDRLDCTRINEEIFKLNFTHPYIVVHASSGAGAVPYLEDAFVACEPRPHYAGAIALMQGTIKAALPFEPDFLVLLDGDTWLLDEGVFLELIQRMDANPVLLMATSSWSAPPRSRIGRLMLEQSSIRHIPVDRLRQLASAPRRMAYDAVEFSTQFCILRNHGPLVEAFCGMRPYEHRRVERHWLVRFSSYFGLERVLRMTEREPRLPDYRFVCERLGLYSEHWPAAGTSTDPTNETNPYFVRPGTPGKREALELYPNIRKGKSIQRLMNTTGLTDLAYYNAGARRY